MASPASLGVRELGRLCRLPKSTVARLVSVLEASEMVERTTDGKVLPGPGLARLRPVEGRPPPDLATALRPALEHLAAAHGEDAALAVDDGDRVVYLGEVSSDGPIRVPSASASGFRRISSRPGWCS